MLPTQMELDVVVRNAIETLTYVNQFVFITQAYVQLITVSYRFMCAIARSPAVNPDAKNTHRYKDLR